MLQSFFVLIIQYPFREFFILIWCRHQVLRCFRSISMAIYMFTIWMEHSISRSQPKYLETLILNSYFSTNVKCFHELSHHYRQWKISHKIWNYVRVYVTCCIFPDIERLIIYKRISFILKKNHHLEIRDKLSKLKLRCKKAANPSRWNQEWTNRYFIHKLREIEHSQILEKNSNR